MTKRFCPMCGHSLEEECPDCGQRHCDCIIDVDTREIQKAAKTRKIPVLDERELL